MAKTVADLIIERLISWVLIRCSDCLATALMVFLKRCVPIRTRFGLSRYSHEEAAAFAVCGYAKYTGHLGVCLATSGLGASICSMG